MSTQDLTQIARQMLTGYNTADWNTLKSTLAPGVIYNEHGSQRKIQGPDAIVQALQAWKKALSDSQGKVTNAIAMGDTVAIEIIWSGTHDGTFTGPMGTLAPTGKKQTTPASMIIKFSGQKMVQINHYFDLLTFLQQLGAMPAAAAR